MQHMLGQADTHAGQPVLAKPTGDEVDTLRDIARAVPLSNDLGPEELLRFVHVEMRATPVLQKLAFSVLVALASVCCADRLIARGSKFGSNVRRKKHYRLGADNLQALMLMSSKRPLLAQILGVETSLDVAFVGSQLDLIMKEGHRRARDRDQDRPE